MMARKALAVGACPFFDLFLSFSTAIFSLVGVFHPAMIEPAHVSFSFSTRPMDSRRSAVASRVGSLAHVVFAMYFASGSAGRSY